MLRALTFDPIIFGVIKVSNLQTGTFKLLGVIEF